MFLLGFLIGGLAGVFTICLAITGDDKDDLWLEYKFAL